MGIEICAFDNVPEDYEEAQSFYHEMAKRNTEYSSHISFYPEDISATKEIENAATRYFNKTNIVACVTQK